MKTANAVSRTLFQHKLNDHEKQWAGPVVHYALGTLLGATYGALVETSDVFKTGFGTGYGAAVWLGADEIAAPTLGLAPPAANTPLSSHISALASHLVFGLVTETSGESLVPLDAASQGKELLRVR